MKEYQSICKIANFVFGRRDVDEEEIYTFSYLPGAGFPYMFNVCCEWSCSSHCPTCLLEEVEEKLKNRHGVDIETDSVIVKDKSVLGIFELMEALEKMSQKEGWNPICSFSSKDDSFISLSITYAMDKGCYISYDVDGDDAVEVLNKLFKGLGDKKEILS